MSVDDVVLGAKVDGHQTTTGTVGIDLKPNNSVIEFDMTFNGVTQTNTQGVTDQATIFTSGYHTFGAQKKIHFDGDRFKTFPATMWVNANNTTTGARTGVSGLPLFGSIADSYAAGVARDKRGQSEAIASGKLRNRLIPEFNQEVDAEFSKSSKAVRRGCHSETERKRFVSIGTNVPINWRRRVDRYSFDGRRQSGR